MKEQIKKYWLVIIIALILGGCFYWFQWRPSQIRIMCQKKVENKDRELLESAIKIKLGGSNGDIYDFCLRENGLEK